MKMIKLTIIGVLLLLTTPIAAQSSVPTKLLQPCVNREINIFNDFVKAKVQSVTIDDFMDFEGDRYYRFFATTEDGYPWQFYVSDVGGQCNLEASGHPNPDLSMLGLPEKLIVKWSIKNLERRISEIGRDKVKAELSNYSGTLMHGHIKAAQSLGLIN